MPGIVVERRETRGGLSYGIIFGRNAMPVVNLALTARGLSEFALPPHLLDATSQVLWQGVQHRLRPEAPDYKSWQLPGILKMLSQGCGLLRWPPGGGKSRAGIEIALALPGPRLILTRAANRAGYVYEMTLWTKDARAYIVNGLDNLGQDIPRDYDFVIAAIETLQFNILKLLTLNPRTIVIDESDLVRSNQRWQAVPKSAGAGVTFLRRRNRAASAQDLLIAADYRFLSTATLFPNKPKDGYAQGDLIEPAAWGHWGAFADRYCARRSNAWGGFEDSGADHLDELRMRWSAITHEVAQSTVNAEMPPVAIVPAFVPKDVQTGLTEADQTELSGADNVAAGGLMLAALRARGYVLDKMEEYVRAGKKVAILTGWQADAERTAAAVAKRLNATVRRGKRKKSDGTLPDGEIPVVLVHGGTGVSSGRLRELEPYVLAVGAAVLIATIASVGRAIDGLQCTGLALFQMLPFAPGELEQAVGRFPRLGRTTPCLIELVIPLGTYAEKVAAILLEKAPAITRLAPTETVSALPSILLNGQGVERAFASILAGPGEGAVDTTPADEGIIL